MLFIIRKNFLFTFLILIFLPLVVLAYFSISTFNKIEQYNENNLETNLGVIKLAYHSSLQDLENSIIQKAAKLSFSNQSNILRDTKKLNSYLDSAKKSNNIDILIVINAGKTRDLQSLESVLNQAKIKPLSSTELIPINIIKKYYKNNINRLKISSDSQISSNNILKFYHKKKRVTTRLLMFHYL